MIFVKKLFVMMLLCVLLCVLGACKYTARQEYINFIADLDLATRFDWCLDKVEKGDATFYTAGELYTIQQDIKAWSAADGEAETANRYYARCTEALLRSIEYYDSGQAEQYEQALADAKENYAEANAMIVTMNAGAENV